MTGLLFATAAPAFAQVPWVVPPQYELLPGTGAANFIYNSAARTYQITFPGSDFASAPGNTLMGFTNRMRSTSPTSWPAADVNFNSYDVYIGELANTSGVLSGTFDENVIPGTEVQVRSGPLTIPAGSAVSLGMLPNPFSSHLVDFQVPFVIDTTRNYIMTIRHTGHSGTVVSWDRLESGGAYAGRSGPSYTATTGGTLANWTIPQFLVAAGDPPCYANCDSSTVPPILNVEDFTCFINEFAAGTTLPHEQQLTHYANCDQSTTAPVLNVEDFTCFINAFATGCP
jgi:hypothetical protein